MAVGTPAGVGDAHLVIEGPLVGEVGVVEEREGGVGGRGVNGSDDAGGGCVGGVEGRGVGEGLLNGEGAHVVPGMVLSSKGGSRKGGRVGAATVRLLSAKGRGGGGNGEKRGKGWRKKWWREGNKGGGGGGGGGDVEAPAVQLPRATAMVRSRIEVRGCMLLCVIVLALAQLNSSFS